MSDGGAGFKLEISDGTAKAAIEAYKDLVRTRDTAGERKMDTQLGFIAELGKLFGPTIVSMFTPSRPREHQPPAEPALPADLMAELKAPKDGPP